jgi:CHAT domain
LEGLDGELVHHFERWLTLRDRTWLEDEIRAFGRLLHRCLFPHKPYDVWSWIQDRMRESLDEPVRLSLEFPTGRKYAHVAAIPWEYLYAPGIFGDEGFFLARDPKVVLSRYAPGTGKRLPPEPLLRVLPVLANPSDNVLGPVVAGDVLAVLAKIAAQTQFEVLGVECNPDEHALGQAVSTSRPHVVHFMGHGRFDSDTGIGSLALRNSGPGAAYEWVSDRSVADRLCPNGHTPRVVVLHTCEGGRADTSFRFAGLAPELISRGVQCVIAMQYPIRNNAAQEFSTALYEQLSAGLQLDEAVQGCRDRMAISMRRDPRLIGVPMLYQRSADPVLAITQLR